MNYNILSNRIRKLSSISWDWEKLNSEVSKILGENFFILGPLFDRVIVHTLSPNYGIILSLNKPLKQSIFVKKYQNDNNTFGFEDTHWTSISTKDFTLGEMQTPNIFLIGLCHKEIFPIPRFHLALSDLASSIRGSYQGYIYLFDMQLDIKLEHILSKIKQTKPELIGISMTFGQYDLYIQLVELISKIQNYNPIITVGGSLANLNYITICNNYPKVIVARGAGETTVIDLIKYFKGEITINEINNISYFDEISEEVITTKMHTKDSSQNIYPELDLLELTLSKGGVMQLESSRGCTYYCSFCPRDHKGRWSNNFDAELENFINILSNIFDSFPHVDKRIFLVDEEFIGYTGDEKSFSRALSISTTLAKYKFKFESSTRIDQVYRPYKDKEWHTKRINFWRQLKVNGLHRMLFGVESGVDSILRRFNKKTTSNQNRYAIRILTGLGVSLRLTYITFDPLMTMDELIDSYIFLSDKTMVLRKDDNLSSEDLFKGVLSEEFCKTNSDNTPLYYKISYLLVSMEALNNSPYTKLVEQSGLLEESSSNLMGKRKVTYFDKRIGFISNCCQLWIDRNFKFDYTLKSFQKISKGKEWTQINILRLTLKQFAHSLLGGLIELVNFDDNNINIEDDLARFDVDKYVLNYKKSHSLESIRTIQESILNEHFELLISELHLNHKKLIFVSSTLNKDIEFAITDWSNLKSWNLINND